MFKEIDLLLSIKKNIESSLGEMSFALTAAMNAIISKTKYDDINCFALLSVLRNTSKEIEKCIFCDGMTTKEKLKIETYLDVLYCLEVNSKRKFKEKDVLKCRELIASGSILNSYYKDLALLCCEVENITHNYDLASYRQYKKAVCKRIGL